MLRSAAKLNLLPIARCLTGGAIRAIANTATRQTSGTSGGIYHDKLAIDLACPAYRDFAAYVGQPL